MSNSNKFYNRRLIIHNNRLLCNQLNNNYTDRFVFRDTKTKEDVIRRIYFTIAVKK